MFTRRQGSTRTVGVAGFGLRTLTQGFGAASFPRQKYGLTERDDATGMDHTWFRKHENRAGRWTSPDPYGGSMSIGDPQSFNRFSYVGADPVNYVDPSGLLRIQECTRIWWTNPDGSRSYSNWHCVTIYDDGGSPRRGYGSGTDPANPAQGSEIPPDCRDALEKAKLLKRLKLC